MRYEELYEMTDAHLLTKTKTYLTQIRDDIFAEEKTKDEILNLLDQTIFYINFQLEVNDKNELDETGKHLKQMWDTHQI